VATVTSRDLRAALDVVYDVCSGPSADPFPAPVLEQLGKLVGAHTVGYCESPRLEDSHGYVLRTRRAAPGLGAALDWWADQDPTHCGYHATTSEPIAISDFLTRKAFVRLEVYQHICRPNDVADSLRLYLPPTRETARFFFFDKERWGFGARERDLLAILRPHLALWRRRWDDAADPVALGLTRREAEILEAVAAGATNREIAERFWISPHTVRTHLQHVFEKLDVSTRTEAAARFRSSADT